MHWLVLFLLYILHFFPVARSFWLIMHTRTAHNLWSLHNFHRIVACVCVCIGNLPLAFAIISIIFFSFRVFRSICLALAFSYLINSMCFVSSIFAVANNSLQGCHAMRHISTIVYSYCDLCICWSATRHKMSKRPTQKSISLIYSFSSLVNFTLHTFVDALLISLSAVCE